MNSGRPRGVVHEQWLSNSEGSSVNSGRPTVVVQQGSSMNSVVKQCSSKLTAHDLQLRKVISPSFELRFGCSWTLWKSH